MQLFMCDFRIMFFGEFLIVKENGINTGFLLFNNKLLFAYQSFTITSPKFAFVSTNLINFTLKK